MSSGLDAFPEKHKTVAPGEVVFLENQRADCAYVVLKGEVQIVAGQDGREPTLINRIPAGEMFGEIALLKDGIRTASALSKDGCELLVLDRAIFDERLAKADPFVRYVVDHLCQLILSWTDRVTRRDSAAPGPRS